MSNSFTFLTHFTFITLITYLNFLKAITVSMVEIVFGSMTLSYFNHFSWKLYLSNLQYFTFSYLIHYYDFHYWLDFLYLLFMAFSHSFELLESDHRIRGRDWPRFYDFRLLYPLFFLYSIESYSFTFYLLEFLYGIFSLTWTSWKQSPYRWLW